MKELDDKKSKLVNNDNSIWKQTGEGDWSLFFNYNVTSMQEKGEIPLQNVKKHLSVGSLVMSPNGMGRLLKITAQQATIKFLKNDEELNFDVKSISNDFNIFIKMLFNNSNSWYRITLPCNGKTDLIKKKINDLKLFDIESLNPILIYQGKALPDNTFFDQLDLVPDTKMLLGGTKLIPFKISRFTKFDNDWYFSRFDGLCFSVNKKIKLVGVGMFCSFESKDLSGTIRISEGGSSMTGKIIYDETIEIPTKYSNDDSVIKIMFKKQIKLEPCTDYFIELESSDEGSFYYGYDGERYREGENCVFFEFKYIDGTNYTSDTENGIFPEFYYLL